MKATPAEKLGVDHSPWLFFGTTPHGVRCLLLLTFFPLLLVPPLSILVARLPDDLRPSVTAWTFVILWLPLLLWAIRRAGIRPAWPHWRPIVPSLLLLVAIGLACTWLTAPLLRASGLDPETLARSQGAYELLAAMPGHPLLHAANLLLVIVLAPLGEELYFRGALQGALTQLLGPRAAILLQALAFALLHAPLSTVGLPMLLIGLILGHLARRHGLATSYVLHLLYNLLLSTKGQTICC